MFNQQRIKKSLGLRLTIIAGISLLLLIPAQMIQSLINERQTRRDEAVKEISQKWGDEQTITGPILSLPFKEGPSIMYAHFLPDELIIDGSIDPEIRYRGLYEAALYNAKLSVKGKFKHSDFEKLLTIPEDILWSEAFISFGISDMKGIRELIKIKWGEEEYVSDPSIKSNDILDSGISIKPALDKTGSTEEYEFSASIDLNGSSKLMFTPIGKITKVDISSTWQNPSFTGSFLPETRNISSEGFDAEWKILNLNRNYPQHWFGNQFKPADSSFGVDLYFPVDEYQKTTRTAKYAIMFISLTFLTFFLMELLNNKIIHPVQYLLIGFALLVFYILLLSFSEHLLFKYAYLIASIGIIALITAYTRSVLKNTLLTIIIGGILFILYGFLYIVLQLEDFAILIGSLGLFIILAIVMYLTRNIDWFSIMTNERKPAGINTDGETS
ncbi:cell envelope integrity protein CreD [Bacteroidota bacterium]